MLALTFYEKHNIFMENFNKYVPDLEIINMLTGD